MKKYKEYKKSGIEWIGEIPKEWKIKRVKDFFKVVTGSTPKSTVNEYWDGEISWVTPVDLSKNGRSISKSERKITEEGYNNCGTEFVNEGSIIISTRAPIGYVTLVDTKLCFNQGCKALSNDKSNNTYHYYFLVSFEGILQMLGRGTTFVELPTKELARMSMIEPLFEEQIQIADYLDDKTSKIDKIIENKKRQVELLKENKNVVIKDILNKGMKKKKTILSDKKWIETYPSNWNLNKIQNTTYVKGRIGWQGLTSEEYLDTGDYYLITGTDFNEGTINWSTCHYIEKERYDEDPYIQLIEKDVLITKDGTIGKIAYVDKIPKPTTLNTGVFVTRPHNKKYIQRFMFWVLNSHLFDSYIEYIKSGSTISHLYQNKFVKFYFPVPPKQEQEEIIEYLDNYSKTITDSIKVIQSEVEKLQEYKQILIHDVVTGKMKVTA